MSRSSEILWPALLALAMTLLSGCPEPSTCVENGCPARQRCDLDLLACVTLTTDCTLDPALCAADQFCSPVSGRCFSRQQRCGREQAQCPRGQQCDAAEGVCKPIGLCNSNLDCDTIEQCSTSGVCEPLSCSASVDCAMAGLVCVEGTCLAGCRLPDAPCAQGRFCRQSAGEPFGECIAGCDRDQDCNFGARCELTMEPAQCVEEPPCDADTDCRSDEVCRQRRCSQSPCSSDEECPEGLSCARTLCVGGDCAEDNFSPNHTASSAATLEVVSDITNLSQCAGRPDWFALDLQDGEVMTIALEGMFASELSLELFDPSLQRLRVDERARGGRARIVYQARADERVLLRISSTLLESSTYGLSIERSTISACVEDSFEQNDGPLTAFPTPLSQNTPVSISLQLCNDDEDWFELTGFEPSSGLRIVAEAANTSPELTLFAPDGQTFPISPGTPLGIARLGTAEAHLLRARDPRRTSGGLSLTLTSLSPARCEEAGEHMRPEDALAVQANQSSTHEFCVVDEAWEVDWFAILPPDRDATLDVEIRSEDLPAVRVALLEGQGALAPEVVRIKDAAAGAQSLTLSARVAAKGALFVRISSEQVPGRLLHVPAYTVVYRYRD